MNKNYLTYLKAESRSPNTISSYIHYVQSALDFIGKKEKDIDYNDINNWLANNDLSSNTKRLMKAAIKNYFNFLVKTNQIMTNPVFQINLPALKVKQKHCPKSYMIRELINNCSNIRDQAMIMFLATTGLRFNEMISITLDQFHNMTGELGREIEVVGKGNKRRTIFINDDTKNLVDKYLLVRGEQNGPLFITNRNESVKNNNFNLMLKQVAKKAKIPFWQDVSAHWLRVAFATTKANSGIPLHIIQYSLGHSNIKTTMGYIKNDQEAINKAMMTMAF
jgi:integrase/recombinase XerD